MFTAAGILMTPLMLRLMKTPAEVAPEQTTYLTIYFAGVMGLLIYNMGSASSGRWATPGVPSTSCWCPPC